MGDLRVGGRDDRAVQTRLLFVPHGESVHTVEGFLGGPTTCRGLTERGRDQARMLADQLAAEMGEVRPISVYSSTLPRAVETATASSTKLGVSLTQDCGLCTWHLPDYADGLPTER